MSEYERNNSQFHDSDHQTLQNVTFPDILHSGNGSEKKSAIDQRKTSNKCIIISELRSSELRSSLSISSVEDFGHLKGKSASHPRLDNTDSKIIIDLEELPNKSITPSEITSPPEFKFNLQTSFVEDFGDLQAESLAKTYPNNKDSRLTIDQKKSSNKSITTSELTPSAEFRSNIPTTSAEDFGDLQSMSSSQTYLDSTDSMITNDREELSNEGINSSEVTYPEFRSNLPTSSVKDFGNLQAESSTGEYPDNNDSMITIDQKETSNGSITNLEFKLSPEFSSNSPTLSLEDFGDLQFESSPRMYPDNTNSLITFQSRNEKTHSKLADTSVSSDSISSLKQKKRVNISSIVHKAMALDKDLSEDERVQNYNISFKDIIHNSNSDKNKISFEFRKREETKERNTNKLHSCPHCSETFPSSLDVKRHIRTHAGTKSFACVLCPESFDTFSDLIRHKRTHPEENTFDGNVCHEAFSVERTSRRHMQNHIKEKLYHRDADENRITDVQRADSSMEAEQNGTLTDYSCPHSSMTFLSFSELQRYLHTHRDRKLHVCHSCPKAFARRFDLMRHEKIHSKENPAASGKYEKVFLVESNLHRHMQAYSTEKSYIDDADEDVMSVKGQEDYSTETEESETVTDHSCPDCPKTFSSDLELQQHRHTHAAIKIHVCDSCPKGFAQHSDLMRHKQIHTRDKPFTFGKHRKISVESTLRRYKRNHDFDAEGKITNCQRTTSRKKTNQIIKVHPCPHCPKKFPFPSHLKRHIVLVHAVKRLACNECPKEFLRKQNLIKHMLIHRKEKPMIVGNSKTVNSVKTVKKINQLKKNKQSGVDKRYSCPQCSQKFVTSAHLKRHMKIHAGIKTHVCDRCSKSFSEKYNLKAHMLTHSEKRFYTCNICQKAFVTKSNLTRHMKEVFTCDVCGEVFCIKLKCKNHMLTHSTEKTL